MRTFEQINNEKKEIMNKKETTAVHTTLAGGQGAHRRSEVKQTIKKKKERMKNEREEAGGMTFGEGGLKKETHEKKRYGIEMGSLQPWFWFWPFVVVLLNSKNRGKFQRGKRRE